MPIQVTCPGCLKRFTVNDKFAGKSGPCPSCRKVIKIPDKSEEVVIHAPEPTGPKDSAGKSVLKPIRRKEVALSMPVMLGAGLATFVVFGLALGIRLTGEAPPTALLVIGALLLAPPLVFVGYWFLRDDELDGYSGRELLIRCGVCALAFAASWLLFAFVPMYLTGEKSMADVPGSFMLFTFPVMIAIGTFVSVGALELEFVQAALHYLLYLAITLILALIMGTKLSDSFNGDTTSPAPAVVSPAVPGAPKTPDAAKPTEKPTEKPAEKPEQEKPKINVLQ
ncbi:MAG: hypothetical protein SFV81_19715 [Pirellulaceae bacterium]|nr:hypothetical protein [Pirellulaceae bacterium]